MDYSHVSQTHIQTKDGSGHSPLTSACCRGIQLSRKAGFIMLNQGGSGRSPLTSAYSAIATTMLHSDVVPT